MTNPFTLLYSLGSRVGRAGYWTGIILNALILIALGLWSIPIAAREAAIRHLHPGLLPEQYTSLYFESELGVEISVCGLFVLLFFYSLLALEVKRWRDRGMSGLMFLIRLLPLPFSLVLDPKYEAFFSIPLYVWIVAQLWFADSAEPGEPGRYFGWSFFSSVLIPLVIFGLIVGAAAFLIRSLAPDWTQRFEKAYVARMAAARAGHVSRPFVHQRPNNDGFNPNPNLDSGAVAAPPDQLKSPPVYSGTSSTDFDRNRVTVAGSELTGISNVIVGSGDLVTIIYAGGGRTFPATSLPQGFLDLWNVTPERLKAADSR